MKTIKYFLFTIVVLPLSFIQATSIKDVVNDTLKTNPKIKAYQENSKAYKLYVDEEYGDYYPTLNYEGFIQDKKIVDEDNTGVKTTRDENGSNQQLKLEQNLYNGGLTSAKVEEAKHNHQEKILANISDSEQIVLDTINAYLDYSRSQELYLLTNNNLEIHNIYLETAIETEKVSGDVVDRLEVEAKILDAKEELIDHKVDKSAAKRNLEQNVSFEINENEVCRPQINSEVLPSSLDELINIGVKNSYEVLQEIEKVKAQRAIISQEQSRFLPSIDVRLLKELDDGIDTEDIKKNNQSVRVTLQYNFFNGFKDNAIYQREKIFLAEAQKNLDDVTNEVIKELKSDYDAYTLSAEKLSLIKENVEKNKEILSFFREQFDGGTRSFIDVLNQEEQLFRKKKDLIEEEFIYLKSYYSLLYNLSKLSDTVLNSNDICKSLEVDYRTIEKKAEVISDELKDLLSEDGGLGLEGGSSNSDENINLDNNLFEENSNDTNEINEVEEEDKIDNKVNEVFNSILDDIYNKNEVESLDINKTNEEEKQELETNKVNEEVVFDEIDNEFLSSDEKYTIVLSTIVNPKVPVSEILSEYDLEKEIFTYNIYQNGKTYLRVLYGKYQELEEAKKVISSLDKKLLKNSPYVNNIEKQRKLYKKYNP